MTTATETTTGEDAGRNPWDALYPAEHVGPEAPGTKAEPALMESVVSRPKRAYDRVLRNKGAAGVTLPPTRCILDLWNMLNWCVG